jgi:hypothetical protein
MDDRIEEVLRPVPGRVPYRIMTAPGSVFVLMVGDEPKEAWLAKDGNIRVIGHYSPKPNVMVRAAVGIRMNTVDTLLRRVIGRARLGALNVRVLRLPRLETSMMRELENAGNRAVALWR